MTTNDLEALRRQLAALQAQIDALAAPKPIIYPSDTITPRPDPSVLLPGKDPLEWAQANPEAARQAALAFVDLMVGGHRTQPTPERDAGADEGAAIEANRYYPGTVAQSELRLADLAYLARMQPRWYGRFGKDIWQSGIVAGRWSELAPLARDGDALRNNYSDEQAQPWLRALVEQRLAA